MQSKKKTSIEINLIQNDSKKLQSVCNIRNSITQSIKSINQSIKLINMIKNNIYKYESIEAERPFQKVFIDLVGLLPKYDGNVCIQKKILLELLKTGTTEEICLVIMKNGLHILENHSSCIQIKALKSIQSKL